MSLPTFLDEIPPGAPEEKIGRLLSALLDWSRGDREAARARLEAIHRSRAYPDYMAELAGHFLLKYPEYVGAPIVPQFAAFDDLVVGTVDRYASQEIGGPLAELLDRHFRQSPSDPLSPLFALLALNRLAAENESSQVEELAGEILKRYPGSKYEARARLARIRILRQALIARAEQLRGDQDAGRESAVAVRDLMRDLVDKLNEATADCVKRFAFLPFVRKDLFATAEALERLDTPDARLKFLAQNAQKTREYPESAELHVRIVMHSAKNATAEETFGRAREHLDLYPESPHRAWMLYLRGCYLLAHGDPAAAFAVFRAILEANHPKWADLAQDEVVAWVRARRGSSDPAALLPGLAALEAFPFDAARREEFTYLHAEILKEAAIRYPKREREAALDRVVLMLQRLKETSPDGHFAALGEATTGEIRGGDIERTIEINRLSNGFVIVGGAAYLAFFLYTATLYPDIWGNWLVWTQLISIFCVVLLVSVLKFLGMF